ncbi:MAG: hypothetical protein KGJ51_05120 [Acidobacteriota bacterium]|nr:hypothetical protein [Acidobacteriota bacterium]
MSSLVEELQRDALDANAKVSNLLRKAKTIAVKLELPELEQWVEHELNGYPDGDVPDYRVIVGQVKGWNPFHGWQPVIFGDRKTEETYSRRRIHQKIAELENAVEKANGGTLTIPFNSYGIQLLRDKTGFDSDFTLMVNGSHVVGLLEAVRNALLEWALKLEKSGIRGQGMSFSADERKKAHEAQAVYNIGMIETFTGNMGSGSGNFSVEGNTVNVMPKAAIESLVRKIRDNETQLGLEPESTLELHQALDGLQTEIEATQPSAKRINGFLASIRGIAEKAAGSLVAQGILYELGKLMHLAAHQ